MNEEQKETAIAVLDRMAECGLIHRMVRRQEGEIRMEPTESGFEVLKSLQRLFTSGNPLTAREINMLVFLISNFERLR